MLLFHVSCLFVYIVIYTCQTVSAEVQSFVTAPSDVNVTQGSTAIIKCQVAHKKGALQWTKDGFALGFNRQIPGFPTYRMDGSEALGEHHLVIDNVQLADDAEFQCQVSPSGGDAALLGRARLNVIVPPAAPSIEGYQNGSQIKVSHKLASLEITCVSQNGRPAATLTWLRNGVAMSDGKGVSIVYTRQPSAGADKLEDGRSVLTIVPKDDDNEATYVCQAANEALQKPLSTNVRLSVLHPPGIPDITGYTSGQVLKTGDTTRMVCISRGGNPLAQLYWYRNNEELDFSYVTGNNRAENELIFTVQPNDNNAVYRCSASNQMTPEPLTTEVKLTVQFAPERVTISGHQNAKAGETVKLRCESTISNPPATLSWFSRGRHLPGGTNNTQPSEQGGFVTTSEISVMLTERENDVIYQCHGTNEALGQTVVDTITLKVMYPPEKPTISGYIDGRSVYAGNALSLTCTSVGGNPQATLAWWKGNRELESVRRVTGNIVSNQVSFLLKPDDNNAEYRCSATNPATVAPLVAAVRLKVSFPPKSLNISLNPRVVKVGQSLAITCQSSTSNPASQLSWWKAGEEVSGVIDGGTVEAENGGRSTISRLQFTPTVEDHGEIYACRARNELLEQAVSDAVTLNVLYKPYFLPEIPVDIVAIEKKKININMTAVGNPTDITYSWYRGDNKLVMGPRFKQVGGVLEVNGFERTEAGVYTCEAQNSEGATRHDFNIDVHFGAEIVNVTSGKLVNQGDTAVLECVVRANPIDVIPLVTWTRPGYDMSRTVIESPTAGLSQLTIAGAERTDSGEFECRASNGIGVEAVATAQLVVKFAPVVDKSPVYRKAAADKGITAALICKADGAPTVNFAWLKDNIELTGADGARYTITETRKTSLVQYESVLYVYNTSKADHGNYQCLASNDLGSDSLFIALDGTSRPDNPYNLQFVNSTHNSLTITWQPGFDGGLSQKFQVRYSEVGGEGSKYEDVIPQGATIYTVKGLKLGTEYELTVVAINRHGESEGNKEVIKARTSAVAPLSEEGPMEDIPLVIILIVCGIGIIILLLNVLLIVFFIRRRRKKLDKDSSESASQANTVEMFNAPLPVFIEDKSYTTYDQRSVDDDYKYPYNANEELGPFFNTTEPFYPASFYLNYGSQPVGSIDRGGPYRGYPPLTENPQETDPINPNWNYHGNNGRHSNGGQRPLSAEQFDELVYREQLRRAQRSMSPGSLQQLARNYPTDDVPRYTSPPDVNYSSTSLKRPPSDETRGHLV